MPRVGLQEHWPCCYGPFWYFRSVLCKLTSVPLNVLLIVVLFFATGLQARPDDAGGFSGEELSTSDDIETGEDDDAGQGGERGIESFTSFLDGEPEEPGELEVEISAGGYETPEAERGAAIELELEYTPDLDGWFWRNLRVSFGVEWERESTPNANRVSPRDFALAQAGRANAGSVGASDFYAEFQDYLLVRPYVDQYYASAGDAEGLRDYGLYQSGRALAGVRFDSNPVAAILSAPFPIASRTDLLEYHQLRLLAGDAATRDESIRAGRPESDGREIENETNFEFAWTQRWLTEGEALGLMVSTEAALSVPTYGNESGVGEFALVFAKTLGPGRVYVNLAGAGPLDGEVEPGERAQYYTGRLGYRWEASPDLALLVGVVREGPREIAGESSTTGELSLLWELGDDLYIGPGVSFSLDGREDTPRWGAGLSIVF